MKTGSLILPLTTVLLACGADPDADAHAHRDAASTASATLDPSRAMNSYGVDDIVAQCKADASLPAPFSEGQTRFLCSAQVGAKQVVLSKEAFAAACDAEVRACVDKRRQAAKAPAAKDCSRESAALTRVLLADCSATPADFQACYDERIPVLDAAYGAVPTACDVASGRAVAGAGGELALPPIGPRCTALRERCPLLGGVATVLF